MTPKRRYTYAPIGHTVSLEDGRLFVREPTWIDTDSRIDRAEPRGLYSKPLPQPEPHPWP